MAAYSACQNDNQYGAASSLSAAERCQDRGAFFDSIQATLNHLVWTDMMWTSHAAGTAARAQKGVSQSRSLYENWPTLKTERMRFDKANGAWATDVTNVDIAGELSWFSTAVSLQLHEQDAICITHMFNHQTHHRGQLHAMLTAAGAKPGATDLALMTVV